MDDGESPLIRLILHKKPVNIILALAELKDTYASVISKKTDCTYPHTLKILDELESQGLVEFKKEGRIKEVKLTRKGVDIAHDLLGLVRRLAEESKEKPEEPAEPEEEGESK